MIKTLRNTFKIIFISSDTFKPFRPDVKDLFAIKIAEKGHEIDWLLQSEKECSKSYVTRWKKSLFFVGRTNNGTRVIDRLLKHFHALINELKVFKLSMEGEYDFILIKDKYLPALISIIASKLFKIQFIFWLSYPFPEARLYKSKQGIARYPLIYKLRGNINHFFQYRVIMKYAHHIFVQSEQMKKDIARKSISEKKMTPVQMGVNMEDIDQCIFSHINNKNRAATLYLGTMAKERNPEFLLRAHKIVLETIPDAQLYMVGDCDDPDTIPQLKSKAEELGISGRVIFTGFVPRQKAWTLIRETAVCLSPYYPTFILNSTSPTKLMEYMALGKPVVATMHPEQKIIISKSNAGICTPWDENSFAQAVIKLLQNPILANHMGKSGRDYIRNNRTYDILANKVISTLHKIKAQS